MPRYFNNSSQIVYWGGTVFPPMQEVACPHVVKLAAYITTFQETFDIVLGVNDTFIIKFNDEDAWTTVTLTDGTSGAAQVVTDINTAYGSTIASVDENKRVRIEAPTSNYKSLIWVKNTGGTANSTLGIVGSDSAPIDEGYCCLVQRGILPLYNPIIAEESKTFSTTATYTYEIYAPDKTRAINFSSVSGGPYTIYMEDDANLPGLTLKASETLTINLKYRVENIVIVPAATGAMVIRELSGERTIV